MLRVVEILIWYHNKQHFEFSDIVITRDYCTTVRDWLRCGKEIDKIIRQNRAQTTQAHSYWLASCQFACGWCVHVGVSYTDDQAPPHPPSARPHHQQVHQAHYPMSAAPARQLVPGVILMSDAQRAQAGGATSYMQGRRGRSTAGPTAGPPAGHGARAQSPAARHDQREVLSTDDGCYSKGTARYRCVLHSGTYLFKFSDSFQYTYPVIY